MNKTIYKKAFRLFQLKKTELPFILIFGIVVSDRPRPLSS